MRAFLTGSRVYGEPRPDSDIDLVVLMDVDGVSRLLAEMNDKRESYGSVETAVTRHGKLNLICFSDEKRFEAWREGTADLIKIAPVTRATAVSHIKAKVVKAGLQA